MKIALFIPCYINALYPQVGEASYRLLRSLGLDVDYPLDQTCCGQPMANAGYERDAQPLAERMEELFAGYDYVVGPSASCVSFVREGYPRLVPHADGGPCLASRIYEICEFVHDVVRPERLDASFHHKVSIHNSCHGVRLMGLSTPSELNIPYRSKCATCWRWSKGSRFSSLRAWTSAAVSAACSPWRRRRSRSAWGTTRSATTCLRAPSISRGPTVRV